ncbi:MAG TPA: spore germination protein GerW family protein [Vicinamibacteria bacterium]|nr:spore germination protein GerW family protein [Vicinamibacteria bacterium]
MPNPMYRSSLLALLLALPGLSSQPQAPLGGPLAAFDQLTAQLTSANVVGEAMRAGDVTVVPFAAIRFGVGSAGAAAAVGGGMGGRVVPLGVLIVQGDEVRVERIPDLAEERSLVHELLQAVIDRKVVFMGNGLNIGNAPGNVSDLESLIAAQMGQTTIIGNALNLGSLAPPPRPPSSAPATSLAELKHLFDAKRYADALSMVNGLLAKDPQSAELKAWKARILEGMAPGTAPPKPR